MIARLRSLLLDVAQKGFFHLFSANLIVSFLGFGSQLLVVKFLTTTEMGNIKTIQSFIAIAGIVAGFGLNTAVLKLCSEKKSADEKSYILKQSFYYSGVPVTIVMLAILSIAQLKLFSPVDEVNHWIIIYMFVLPASVLSSLAMVFLQALKKIQQMAKIQVVLRVLSLILLLALTYFFGFRGYVLSAILIGIVTFLPLLCVVKDYLKPVGTYPRALHQAFYYAKWSLAANLVYNTSFYMDIFLLNYLLDDRVGLGYYSVATIFFGALTQIPATVQSIATPYLSEKSNDKEEFLRVLNKYQGIMIVGSSLVAAVAIVFVPVFVRIVYGERYALTGDLFRILCTKYFFMSCHAVLGVAIIGLGKMKYNFFTQAVTIVVTVPLSYLLIKWLGLFGAAIAQSISSLCVLVVMLFMIKHVVTTFESWADRAYPVIN